MSKNVNIADLINYISVDESGNVVLSTGGQVATQSYVTTAVSNLVNSAPTTLDTLNELAAALGNDANFATTVTNSIATKLPLSGGTLTGALNGTSATFSGAYGTSNGISINGTTYATLNSNRGASSASAGVNYSSIGNQKWFTGIYENSDNFGFYNTNLNAFPFILNYSSGAATFSSNANTIFNSSSTFSYTGGNYDVWNFLAPNQSGGALSFNIGKSLSSYNNAALKFHYLGNNSTSNFLGIGFFDNDNILNIKANGYIGMGTTSPTNKLHIDDPNYNTYAIRIVGSGVANNTNRYTGIGFSGESANTKAAIFFVSDGTAYSRGALVFANNSDFNQNNVTLADEKMRVSSVGVVTKPYQPLAMGAMSGDQYLSPSSFTTISFSTSYGFNQSNIGNHWNNSNHTFTAPATGLYLINASLYTNNVGQIAAFVNGNRNISMVSGFAVTGGVTWHGTIMIKLNSGDSLTLRAYGESGGYIYLNTYHTWFGIYFLG